MKGMLVEKGKHEWGLVHVHMSHSQPRARRLRFHIKVAFFTVGTVGNLHVMSAGHKLTAGLWKKLALT